MMQSVLILVVALQGLLLPAPINSSFIVGELSTLGCIGRPNYVAATV